MAKRKQAIRITCTGSDSLPLSALHPFQGSLKALAESDYKKLRNQILDLGFSEPISTWYCAADDKRYILNGHQRLTTLNRMAEEGYELPYVFPINDVQADDIEQAKRKVLSLASQYGTVTKEGLYEFLEDAQISSDEFAANYRFPEIDIPEFVNEFYPTDEASEEPEKPYTAKTKAPIYKPTGEKPALSELLDYSKARELKSEIIQHDLPKDVMDFLLTAAERHVVFNYERIAEYYAHAPKEVQELMENSALVIIDFDKAIEKGFVSMTKNLAEVSPDAE